MAKRFTILSILLIFLDLPAFGQGLFESATSGAEETGPDDQTSYELNGFLRATLFVGKVPGKNEAETKSSYAEADLQLKANKTGFGDAFAELGFRNGSEFHDPLNDLDLAESYVNLYVGRFDFRVGHQIVVWGRADGFNPTDNITPKDYLTRSPDEDDRRLANFLFRTWFNAYPVRLEAIWIPNYAASVIPTDIVPLPDFVTMNEPEYPGANLNNTAVAVRMNFEWPSIDGSISYFNGYNPSPGIDLKSVVNDSGNLRVNVAPRAYCQHIVGADFQTTKGDMGFRGEFAYRYPYGDFKNEAYIPNPDFQWVIGFERQFGSDFSFILQYMGRYVFDFTELTGPVKIFDEPKYMIAVKNRQISFQTDEITHAISFRPAWTLLHETLTLETLGMYNFVTEELMLRPKLSYEITDDLSAIFGGEIYTGPEESVYGSIDSYLSAVYFELRASF